MNLYIETENGTTKNHPAQETNLILAFDSVPAHWEPFVRVQRPVLGAYQVLESEEPIYAKVNGVWTDVWSIRDMTAEEKIASQQAIRDTFLSREYGENWSAWTYDEITNNLVPPIPRPAANPVKTGLGVFTFWCGAEGNWKDTPKKPFDEKKYKFDFIAWQWVELTSI